LLLKYSLTLLSTRGSEAVGAALSSADFPVSFPRCGSGADISLLVSTGLSARGGFPGRDRKLQWKDNMSAGD
jgi:hypothetical protein